MPKKIRPNNAGKSDAPKGANIAVSISPGRIPPLLLEEGLKGLKKPKFEPKPQIVKTDRGTPTRFR
jgi:hypothetical protein